MPTFNVDNLQDLTNRTVNAGATISASDHEAWRNDVEQRVADLNDAALAAVSMQSGSSTPTLRQGAIWYDTSNSVWKGDPDGSGYDQTLALLEQGQTYTGANTFSGANKVELANGSAGDPSLSFDSDEDNGIYRVGADVLGVSRGLEIGPGGNSDRGRVPCVLHTDTTEVGNVGSGEDDLMSHTLPGGTLANDGDEIIVIAGFKGNGTDNVIATFKFGSTNLTVYSGGSIVGTTSWAIYAELRIVRIGSSSQMMIGIIEESASSKNLKSAITSNPNEDTSSDITIKFTGQNNSDTSSDAIVQTYMKVKFDPAGP